MNFAQLRELYPSFIYHDYIIDETADLIKITYHFEIVGLSSFYPTWTIKKNNLKEYKNIREFKECVFNLGLVELISYWKLTCSKDVFLNVFLDEYQLDWWKKLYFYGLGEFFYINNIKTDIDNFMNIITSSKKIEGETLEINCQGNLIPVGGGKDSFVSLELLKDYFNDNHVYVINHVKSALAAAIAAGYKDKLINVERTLDPNMLALNKKGFLNGHTPFSALVAFSGVLVAMLYEKKYICLSNEASANESTVLDEEVNHQYSKSYQFEADFNQYIFKYVSKDIKYFSLLRGLSELEITYIFSTLKKYHSVFKSCNVGSKEGMWCNHCAKCLFVYVMLSAYLNDDELFDIFNKNLLEDESLYELLKELSGLKANKPFECVGTRDEVNIAVSKAIKLRKDNLPVLYRKYLADNGILKDEKIFDYYNEENFIPEEYEKLIKKKLGEYYV